jgi:glutamate racemase
MAKDEPALATQPIGVFDSGIGGLTVVSALRALLPNESIYYLGDTARVPYGGKSAATVQRYSLEIAAMLLGENAKTVVVACNTASALARERRLRRRETVTSE